MISQNREYNSIYCDVTYILSKVGVLYAYSRNMYGGFPASVSIVMLEKMSQKEIIIIRLYSCCYTAYLHWTGLGCQQLNIN